MNTSTLTMLPVLGCLKAAEEFLGQEGKWTSVSEAQESFLKRYRAFLPMLDKLSGVLRRKASKDVSVINDWLKENGFDIHLPETTGGFAVASILDVLVEWMQEGKECEIRSAISGKMYPAVALTECVRGHLDLDKYPFPIACIKTKTSDKVYMAVLDEMPIGVFGLADKVESLRQVTQQYEIAGVHFPMIDYNSTVDISWIEKLRMGNDWYVDTAIQQTKFRMNHKGARVQSAVAMSFRCMSLAPKPEWINIDRPFVIWIERPEFPMPLFAGVFCEDVWKKPKELEEV